MTLTGGSGLTMSTFASVWYGYIKHQQSERNKKKIEKDPGPSPGETTNATQPITSGNPLSSSGLTEKIRSSDEKV